MARARNKYSDYLQYLGLRLFGMFAHMFEVSKSYRTARWMGELMWRIDRRHRRVACGHLRLSFPHWPEARVRRVARKSFHNLLYLGVEVLFMPRLIKPNRWRRHVRFRNMGQMLRLMLRQESGLILVTGHFGNFLVVEYTMAAVGIPTVSVARPLDNPYVWNHMMKLLEGNSQRFLYKKGAMRSAEGVLGSRGALSFVADQDAGRKGLFVDFFGRPASTYKSIAMLAIRHQAPVVIGYGKRLREGFNFEIGVARIIRPQEWAHKQDPVTWITEEFTRELERIVRDAPEQYLWVHRRWKHRPDGSRAGGDGVA